MVRYLEYIALFLAVAAVLGACSNSLEPADPFEDLLSIQFESCDNTESGDIHYKAEKDEYSACIDEQWMHVDINAVLQDYSSDENDSATIADPLPCNDGDKKFKAKDSSYKQCSGGIWKRLNENWVIIPVTERFLQVQQGKFIPDANFNTPFALQPPQPLNGGIVRCTFDGSEPDSTTQEFIENRVMDSTTVVRCYEFAGNEIKQKQTETYFINESINMPVVSISVDPMYVRDYLDAEPCEPAPCKSAKFWEDVEYPTHVEYFAEGSSAKKKGFEIDAGISIVGQWSRNQQKKSVSIVMRKEYQDGRLHYPLFETRPENSKFKAFILRNNGNRFISDYIEDAMATSLLEGTNVDYQRSRMVIVFYNGNYRGIYDMREKLNEHFVETNYGIDSKSVDFIKHSTNTIIKAQNGSDKDYIDLLKFVYNNDLSTNDAYDSIKKMIDLTNFMEYISAEIYYHNGDWPQNNIRAWKTGNGPWRFIAFDIDYGFDWTQQIITGFSQNTDMIEWLFLGGRPDRICRTENNTNCFHNIFAKLIKNKSFKQAFINRATYIYSTYINAETASKHIDKINNSIDQKQIQRDLKLYKREPYTNACGTRFDIYGDCIKKWVLERDKNVKKNFSNFFNLDSSVSVSIELKGNAHLKLDGFYMPQKNRHQWETFKNHPIELDVECLYGENFKSWENGLTIPHRQILPQKETHYSAECN